MDTTADKPTTTRDVYERIARSFDALHRCEGWNDKRGDCSQAIASHKRVIADLVATYFPSGSGFDNGTKLDLGASKPERLVFSTAFHHMNDGGFYDGWTSHEVIVTPSLTYGFQIRVSGRNRRDIKAHIAEMFATLI